MEKISNAVKALCILLIKQAPKGWKWLYGLPLYHFTSGLSVPFRLLPTQSKSVNWVFWKEFKGVKLNADK